MFILVIYFLFRFIDRLIACAKLNNITGYYLLGCYVVIAVLIFCFLRFIYMMLEDAWIYLKQLRMYARVWNRTKDIKLYFAYKNEFLHIIDILEKVWLFELYICVICFVTIKFSASFI